MFQLKITIAPPSHHLSRKVKCKDAQYTVDIPLQTYRFVDIVSDISFKPEFEPLLAILSKQKQTVQSFAEFYKSQEDAAQYFNRTVGLDFDDLSFKFLSESDKIFNEIDKCKFNDLLAIIRKAYDSFSEKLHSKFNRRIKKYLTVSTRSAIEKENVKKLVDLIKADSTEEEPKPQVVKKVELKKEPSAKKPKTSAKEQKNEKADNAEKIEKIQKASKKTEKEPIKEQKIEVQEDDNEEDDIQQEKPQKIKSSKSSKIQKVEKTDEPTKHKHQNKHHQHHNKKEDDQADWEDVKIEKFNKRKEKNNRRKHEKFDIEATKHEQINSEHQDEEQVEIKPKQKKEKVQRKSQNKASDQDKKLFDKVKDKQKKDFRVLLGLNGDTEDGWRERYRMERVPPILAGVTEKVSQKKTKWKPKEQKSEERPVARKQRPQKKQEAPQKQENTEKQTPKNEPEKEPPTVEAPKNIIIPSSQGSLQKIFSYPSDGKKFILDPSKEYRIRVNNNFWIILEKNLLKIEKDRTGYIRSGKFSSSSEYLIEAEDLTIAFDGLCNLQDGGTPFGDPVIQSFTGAQSQWFHLKQLEVYTYK